MFNIQKHLRHVVLALGLAAASLTAGATVLPTYHIGVADTATADIAYIDFVFGGINDAVRVKATLSHFTGMPVTEFDRAGAVSGTPEDGFTFLNDGTYNDLYLAVSGPFAFDLNFSEQFLDSAGTFGSGSFFSIGLYDSDSNLIGDSEGALYFSLSQTGVLPTSNSPLLSLTEVPEPTDWMLMLTGLVFVVTMTRRNGRANARRLASAQA
jgi:hypothetical protein